MEEEKEVQDVRRQPLIVIQKNERLKKSIIEVVAMQKRNDNRSQRALLRLMLLPDQTRGLQLTPNRGGCPTKDKAPPTWEASYNKDDAMIRNDKNFEIKIREFFVRVI